MDEQLKQLKKDYEIGFPINIDWLIQQAERVPELESEVESYCNNYNRAMSDVIKVGRERDNYFYKNQRYKEALVEVRDCIDMFYDNGTPRRIRPEFSSLVGFIHVMDSTCNKLLKGES